VTADRDGLTMARRHLLEKALKFTRNVPQPMIRISGGNTGTTCILSVCDNSVGFDMKFRERIFDIFQRLRSSEDRRRPGDRAHGQSAHGRPRPGRERTGQGRHLLLRDAQMNMDRPILPVEDNPMDAAAQIETYWAVMNQLPE
jgi:hypothetical protein